MDGVKRATGRDRSEWFELLEGWGARGRPFREISKWLTTEHGLSKWWAQKLIVEYEQDRGVRPPGVRADGTFEVGASKTIQVPVQTVFDSFVDGRHRRKWLTDAKMTLQTSEPARSARFDWGDGVSRVNVDFVAKGESKTTVSVIHQRLSSAELARSTKEMWRERLRSLKSQLES